MPSRKSVPGSSDEWFQRACGDLALASAHVPDGVFYEDLCFHAQQAAEKALKAIFVYYGFESRYPGVAEPVSEEEYREALTRKLGMVHDQDETFILLQRKAVNWPTPR